MPGPKVIKLYVMLNSDDHENSNNFFVICRDIYDYQCSLFTKFLFFEQINQVWCCILNFIQNQNLSTISAEHEKSSITARPGPKVIKLFSCSAELSMIYFLLLNVKTPTVIDILKNIAFCTYSEPEKS